MSNSNGMDKGIKVLSQASDKFFKTAAKGGKLAVDKTTDFIEDSVSAGMELESKMNSIQTITMSSSYGMERLYSLARKVGETTGFSAEAAGQELERMAKA
ncbi:phage tail tape measure protein [Lacrimispora saccharolytica]|uniref:phage tail tape measure protein n=1 Tax=Lacrimispora saccharolytica TaxID=84030 RepID=UPI0002E465D4|nr:phage tail tape measure protein [Lacrimispora saccharolytica]QRV18381.1 phage tail tape measure protein [Lacrimispora saccharolytica]